MNDQPPGGPPAQEQAAAGAPSGAAPPLPPTPPPVHRTLCRSTGNRVVCGVAGGLGEYFAVDALFFRIGFIALSFLGGLGVFLYVAAWFLIPEAGSARVTRLDSWNRRYSGRTRGMIGAGLLVVALFVAADSLHLAGGGLLAGLVLLAVGTVLLVDELSQPREVASTGMPAPARYAASSFTTAGAATPPTDNWGQRHAGHPRSVLGLITVAVALLAVGATTLIAGAVGVTVNAATALGIIVVTLGAGLVVGAWFGRSRLLICLGVVMLPLAASAALVNEPLSGGTGDVQASPRVLADMQPAYHLAAGHLTLDLTQVDFRGVDPTVKATVALGQLTVIVPQDITVDMRGHAGAGELDLLGHIDDGLNIDAATTSPGAHGTLHLDLSVGLGQVNVVNAPAAPPAPGSAP